MEVSWRIRIMIEITELKKYQYIAHLTQFKFTEYKTWAGIYL